jgi:RHS repeat-associated protein
LDSFQNSADFQYDRLGRLTFDGRGNWHYDYDPAGNRVRERDSDSGDTSYSYEDFSNRMDSRGNQPVTRDAAGNSLSDARRSYQYNAMNRLSQVTMNSGAVLASYQYNYKGERVHKQVSGSIQFDTRYVYGQDGELLGEYGASGNRIREYVYFRNNGINELIAFIESDGSILYVYTDHLHTPRVVTDDSGKTVWRWISDVFGSTLPNEDPDGDGVETILNHRFPGQYYDVESGLHYNYFRYYDPETGRYITSDPIGLQGGLNTYTYVGNNPMAYIDPAGLEIIGEWVKKGIPEITEVDIVWGNARRPDNWWKFWEHGYTYRSMEHAVDVRVGYSWDIQCFDTCNDDSWNIDGGLSESFRVYVPVFTPIHPRVSRYTSIANPAYNLLIKPAINDTLEKAGEMARLFYSNMTASEVCNLIQKGR